MDLDGGNAGQARRAKKRNLYTICRKAGLTNFTNKFALGAMQLGHALQKNAMENRLLPQTPRDQDSKPIPPKQFEKDNKEAVRWLFRSVLCKVIKRASALVPRAERSSQHGMWDARIRSRHRAACAQGDARGVPDQHNY